MTAEGHEEIDRTIRQAVVGRKAVRVTYEGQERLVCPYMIGRNREGQTRVLCLQVGGASTTGLEQKNGAGDWRCLALEKIGRAECTSLPWVSVGDFVVRPKCIDQVELTAGGAGEA